MGQGMGALKRGRAGASLQTMVKQSLFKATGRADLTKEELEEILLDKEIVLNNLPLIYLEGDI